MKTIEISGMGEGYEKACQTMLTAGLKFLSDHPKFDWSGYRSFKGIVGVVMTDTPEAKALDRAMLDAVEKKGGGTGAMHQSVIGHLKFIYEHSYWEWIRHVSQHRGEQPIEIDDPLREALVRSVEGKLP